MLERKNCNVLSIRNLASNFRWISPNSENTGVREKHPDSTLRGRGGGKGQWQGEKNHPRARILNIPLKRDFSSWNWARREKVEGGTHISTRRTRAAASLRKNENRGHGRAESRLIRIALIFRRQLLLSGEGGPSPNQQLFIQRMRRWVQTWEEWGALRPGGSMSERARWGNGG